MGAGASVLWGNQGRLAHFCTERLGYIIIRGEIAGFDADGDDGDMSVDADEYEDRYEEDYDEIFGHPNENMNEADWIRSTTESD